MDKFSFAQVVTAYQMGIHDGAASAIHVGPTLARELISKDDADEETGEPEEEQEGEAIPLGELAEQPETYRYERVRTVSFLDRDNDLFNVDVFQVNGRVSMLSVVYESHGECADPVYILPDVMRRLAALMFSGRDVPEFDRCDDGARLYELHEGSVDYAVVSRDAGEVEIVQGIHQSVTLGERQAIVLRDVLNAEYPLGAKEVV